MTKEELKERHPEATDKEIEDFIWFRRFGSFLWGLDLVYLADNGRVDWSKSYVGHYINENPAWENYFFTTNGAWNLREKLETENIDYWYFNKATDYEGKITVIEDHFRKCDDPHNLLDWIKENNPNADLDGDEWLEGLGKDWHLDILYINDPGKFDFEYCYSGMINGMDESPAAEMHPQFMDYCNYDVVDIQEEIEGLHFFVNMENRSIFIFEDEIIEGKSDRDYYSAKPLKEFIDNPLIEIYEEDREDYACKD